MSESYTATQRAAGKVRIGIERLAGEFPFHAAILERMKLSARPDVGTMGVTVAGDDILLYYNPEFVLAVTADELGGVLLHEVHHVLFGHVTADPADYPDEWARLVAEEVTVNEFITLPLPGDPITLAGIPGLPPGESTAERFDRLRGVRNRGRVGILDGQRGDGGAGMGACGPREVDRDDTGSGRVPAPLRSRPAASPAPTRSPVRQPSSDDPEGAARKAPGELGQTVDDHGVWSEARRDADRSRRAIREVVEQALLEVGPETVPDHLTGRFAGHTRLELRGHVVGRLDWRHLLRRYVGKALEVRPGFDRPPRRFPELVGILPGQRRRPARPRILAIVDTSGSITPEWLERIDAELARLARRYVVTVVECDSAVQRAYPYRPLAAVAGRGGTDLRPPLERGFLRAHRAELVVYFTDGFGPAPERPPEPPVIWCLVPGGEAPATWGRCIPMVESP
jgi:predicted metal-dependent peptidase